MEEKKSFGGKMLERDRERNSFRMEEEFMKRKKKSLEWGEEK